jgi:hypothetical protein
VAVYLEKGCLKVHLCSVVDTDPFKALTLNRS